MGKSITVNIIGVASPGNGTRELFYAENKTEMKQLQIKNKGRIKIWYAQTSAGAKALRVPYSYVEVDDSEIAHVRLSRCIVCNGQGSKKLDGEAVTGLPLFQVCVICNGSGYCRKGNEKHWAGWQIESMKQEWKEVE